MKQPKIVIPKSVAIPPLEEIAVTGGARLYRIDNGGEGVFRVSFVFGAGSSHQSVPFSAGAVLNLLGCGTAKYSAEQIAERLDFYGSYYDASIDRDYAVVTFCSLASRTKELLDIASEVILRPTFAQTELATYCGKRKNALRSDRMRPDFLSRELFGRTLFGPTHPYGISSSEELYDNLSRETIVELYNKLYTAENCFAVMVGDSGESEIKSTAAILKALPQRAVPKVLMPEPESSPRGELSLQGAVQSSICVGRTMFPRSHPDFVPMQVVATVLGGYYGSRLMHNLREVHGYTYGAYAAMVNLEHSGYFAISTEVGKQHTEAAVGQISAEIESLCSRGVDRHELEVVRRMLFGEVMRILDGPLGIADIAIENICNGTDNSYTERFVEKIRTITPSEVLSAAREHLSDSKFTVTVVD